MGKSSDTSSAAKSSATRVAPKRRLARRPVEQTKELMLTAAMRLLERSVDDDSDDGLAFVVSNIRVTDVVAEATRMAADEQGSPLDEFHPFTIGALYQIWPTQPEFQAALLMHVTQLRSVVYPTAETTQAHIAEGITGEALPRPHHDRGVAPQPVRPAGASAARHVPADREPADPVRDGHELQSFFGEVSGAWRLILAECGRRPRPPLTEEHVARAIAAVIEGFSLQWLSDPDALADPHGEDGWDLTLRTIVSMLDSLTEPVPTRRTS